MDGRWREGEGEVIEEQNYGKGYRVILIVEGD